MKIRNIFPLFLFPFFFLFSIIQAQNIEQVVKAKPITIKGGANVSSTGYSTSGGDARRDPFSYQLSANINCNFFGVVDAPFSAYMTSENKTFNLPSYNMFGISPSYKWITVHAGWRSMEFSPYTLSGSTFLGVGIELQPEEFPLRGKILYGRFAKKSIVNDTITPYITEQAYNRWGYGAMISVGQVKNSVDISIFHAEDKPGDNIVFADSTALTPQENFSMSIATNQQLAIFNLKLQYVISTYTDDIRSSEKEFSTYTYLNNLGFLYTPRYSSRFGSVWDGALNANFKVFVLGLSYKRIDPGYKSMGTPFLNSDVEDIQANASTNMFDNKVGLSGSFGVQHNNLDNKQYTNNKRYIGSFNVNWQILQNLSTNISYSNFNSSTEPTRIMMQDSVKYAQISQNLSIGANYNIGNENFGHLFNIMYARQTVNTVNTDFTAIERIGTIMNNATVGYRLNYKPADAGIGLSFNISHYLMDSVGTFNYGPQISTSKSFFDKKLRTSISYSLQCSQAKIANNGYVNAVRFTAGYNYNKHHNLSLNSNYVYRSTQPLERMREKTNEFMMTIAYNYTF